MRIELNEALQSPLVLSRALGASLKQCGTPPPEIKGVCTDSGEVVAGDLFVALRGTRHSGEEFVGAALAQGAAGVLTTREIPATGNYWRFCAADTEHALLAAAAWYRRRCGSFVIAVTGSAGKTTAKEAVCAVLGGVPHSMGNFNSTVGMPLSVLSLPKAPYWVLELGINHVGEMQKMASALSPDLGVLTNVGTAHIGEFGDYATLVAQKVSLAAYLKPQGRFLMPIELPLAMIPAQTEQIVRFGQGAEITAENIVNTKAGTRCDLRGCGRVITNLTWPIPGRIGIGVILLAGGVGLLLGKGDGQIRDGLLAAGAARPRMRQISLGTRLLLDDSYNASPESTVAALEALSALAEGRPSVAVLGDMCELGRYSAMLHDAVGVSFASQGHAALFTYGAKAMQIASGAARAGYPGAQIHTFPVGQEVALAQAICERTAPDCVMLCKASRAVKMERVIEAVRRNLEI